MEEWQERQTASEFAIMQLADIVKNLCLITGGKAVWDETVATWKPVDTTGLPNVVPLFDGASVDSQLRIKALTAGLLESRHPLEVLANLASHPG